MREGGGDDYGQRDNMEKKDIPEIAPRIDENNTSKIEKAGDFGGQENPEIHGEIKRLVHKLNEKTNHSEECPVNLPKNEESKVPGKLVKTTETLIYKIEERVIEIDGIEFVYRMYFRKRDGVVDNCKVMNSYKIDDPEIIRKFIDEIFENYPKLLSRRDKESYCRERLAHNFLYKLHILRIATRDVDMDIYSIKLLQKAYQLMGKWNLSMQKRNKSK